jgi:hypothetical protein
LLEDPANQQAQPDTVTRMVIIKKRLVLLFVASCLFSLVLFNKKRLVKMMTEIAEHVKQKIDDVDVVQMIDAAIGEIVYLSIVSAGQMTDLLLDIRQAVIATNTNLEEN